MATERLTITVEEAGEILGISRALAYEMARCGKLLLEATIREAETFSTLAVTAAQDRNLDEVLIQVGKMAAVLEKGRDILSRTELSNSDIERLRNTIWLEVKTRATIIEALGKAF